jgi:protein-histidine pros-kinase
MTELLRQMALPPEAAGLVETIHMSGEHLLALVNDLLDSARLESGRLQLEHVDFLLREVVEEAVEIAAATTGARRLSVAAVIDPRLPDVVRGDPRRLGQVLRNLLGNAVKFTPAGHVALRLQRLAEERAHVVCRLEVEDTGIGMPPEDVPRLFEPFMQADEATARRFGGTGLGLSIASRLVEAMGSRIEVDTAPGRGSRFRINLRLERAGRRDQLALPGCQGLRVALATPDPLLVDAIGAQAARLGVSTECLSTALGGAPEHYVVLLLDPRSPEAETHRAAATAAGVPVVCLLPPGAISPAGSPLHLRLPVRLSALAHVLATLQPHVAHTHGAPAPLPGRHVLVVEDNDANQMLVQCVLDSVGVTVDLVATGEEACEALRRRHYDLVFMDCRLPGMDGLAVTRAARADRSLPRVPIIGLSASIQAGTRQACLAAGMNDFLAKPARPSALLDALRRWLPTTPASRDAAAPCTHGPAVGTARFDPTVLTELRRLGVLPAMIAAATRDLPRGLAELREASTTGDLARLALVGHRFTTMLGNVGWTRAADLASRLEVACDRPGAPAVLTLARALEQEVLEGRHALEPLLSAPAPEMPC